MNGEKQKILIIGAGGGREHALSWKLAQSPHAGKLFFAKGNPGTAQIGTNLEIKETETASLVEFAKKEKIDLVLVASDDLLAQGTVDEVFQHGVVRHGGADGGDVREGEFPRQDDLGEPHVSQEAGLLSRADVALGGGVQVDGGQVQFQQP